MRAIVVELLIKSTLFCALHNKNKTPLSQTIKEGY